MGDFLKSLGLSEGMISYTFTASTLPIPILVLFAGALADRVDRRKLLIVTHLWMMLAAGALGLLTIGNFMTPWLLLAFLFAIGAGYAMMNPALLAVLPELVEPRELKSAMALNSVNMNIARVLGPAIGGLIIVVIAARQPYLYRQGDRIPGDGRLARRRGLGPGPVETVRTQGRRAGRIDSGGGMERSALHFLLAAAAGDHVPHLPVHGVCGDPAHVLRRHLQAGR